MSKKVIISGVAGFIGSNFAKKLLKFDYTVMGIDNFSCGFEYNMREFVDHKNFTFFERDIRHLCSYDIIIEKCKDADIIFHMAAEGATYICQNNPQLAADININGTIETLLFAKKIKAKHFVFMDTSAEYDNLPLTESSFLQNKSIDPVGLITKRSCFPLVNYEEDFYYINYPSKELYAPTSYTPMGYYAITKMAASQFVRSMCSNMGMGSTLIRPFNVYGKSLNLERDIPPVIGSFAKDLLLKKNPTIFGNGKKRRDFIYIDDVTEFLLAVMSKRINKEDSETFNLGASKNFSVQEIYEMVAEEIFESDKICWLQPFYAAEKSHETFMNLADMSKVFTYFPEWRPKMDIKEGIHLTVKSVAERLGVDY